MNTMTEKVVGETVRVKKLPGYSGPSEPLFPEHASDAGVDLYAAEVVTLVPGERALCRTGLSLELPVGYEAQIRPKSGRALKEGLTVLNTPGTIDAGYRGEVGVILFNANLNIQQQLENYSGKGTYGAIYIQVGQKIGQLVFNKIESPRIELVEELSDSSRGEGGFGSTGI